MADRKAPKFWRVRTAPHRYKEVEARMDQVPSGDHRFPFRYWTEMAERNRKYFPRSLMMKLPFEM